jgi:hypothetical protein
MADLNDLQKRLNSDPKLRERFLADPVKTFEDEGVVLPPQAKDQLRELTKTLQSPQKPVSGASVAPQGAHPMDISINISKSF